MAKRLFWAIIASAPIALIETEKELSSSVSRSCIGPFSSVGEAQTGAIAYLSKNSYKVEGYNIVITQCVFAKTQPVPPPVLFEPIC